jgi:integrase
MIKGKGGKHRLVSLNPTARDAVRAYMKVRRAVSGEHALFISHAGRRLSYPALRNTFQKVSRVVGVKVNPHDLRRFAHTHLWMSDISQIDGMLISGHSDPQVYQRYVRAAMQLRALREHRARSPLDALLR